MDKERSQPEGEIVERAPEFNCEQGVDEVMRRIQLLLGEKDVVFVGINGSSINVGKSHLSLEMKDEISGNAYFTGMNNPEDGVIPETILSKARTYNREKVVCVISQAWFGGTFYNKREQEVVRFAMDRALADDAGSALGVSTYDLIIGIQTETSPFGGTPVADIIINNEKAKVK